MLIAHTGLQNVATEIVEAEFLGFFRPRGYTLLPGSPLVDESIKMSFVMSAGLVQIEQASRLTGQPLEGRFALVQSCFRHFDMLEGFGTSPYHLSFFRMAGAFDFGPIERRARIAETWALLSEVYHLKSESLWITYYCGAVVSGYSFDPDRETYQGWLDVGIPAKRIIGLKENFWKQSPLMGDSIGHPKCGPNCEVFFDYGEQFACGPTCLPGCRCGRFVEFLNMLFIGWERDLASGQFRPLDNPFVEVVIGVERLSMVLQGAASVYQVESLPQLFGALEESMGKGAVQGMEGERQMRLMADHLRAMLFLVADGAPPPGRGGRARIMRRLARNLLVAQKLLDLPMDKGRALSPAIDAMLELLLHYYRAEQPLPGQLVPRMLAAHPDLPNSPVRLLAYLGEEALLFEQTLQRGLHKLERLLAQRPKRRLSGREMLELEISDGIPSAYLVFILRQKQIAYSWDKYISERTKWQKSTVQEQSPTP